MNLHRDYSALDRDGVRFEPDPARPLALFAPDPEYRPTAVLEVEPEPRFRLLIKNETSRLGLPAFKALGGIYAVSRLVGERWYRETGEHLPVAELNRPDVRRFAGRLTFVCASAGNHGLAVARGARRIGASARVHLAETVPEAFVERLAGEGAEVRRSGSDYEASVDVAMQDAESSGAMLLADGSWPGYLDPPALVMEGYTLIAEELREGFARNSAWPDRVYLQAGVGGLAAAMTYMIRSNWPVQPEVIVVEPEAAPCLRESHSAGRLVRVHGPESVMGRLDCKVPSLLALDVLGRSADRFITVSDTAAERAVERLGQFGVATTPSGAAGLAGVLGDGGFAHGRRSLILATEASV
ncbi:pyridoxal-phosphate dependent enzyme [Elongatibacter sediminis]|uniref:Pyridoxal-phosphate dependent enzyme n=1 Tax=Elongatibacter sediminis TaxID=3119006 RepID=A0AAW9RC57_9GAMM